MTKHSVKQGGMGDQALGVGGIDVAKDWHYIQWLDGSGRHVGKAFRFANTHAGSLAQLATLAVTRRQHHQDFMRWRALIAGWLHQYFPEFLTVFKAWDGKAALTVLDAQPTPDLVPAAA